MELQIDTDQREQSQVNIGSMENVINNYFIDNRGTMLFLIEEHEELLKEKIKTYEHVFIEPTSEDLFQYISAEKSAPLIILKEFYPSSNSKYENAKIINIIKQLLYYGQAIICISDEDDENYCNQNIPIFSC